MHREDNPMSWLVPRAAADYTVLAYIGLHIKTVCNTQEVKLMTVLRKLDVSWNAPMALQRSDAHLFAGLPRFESLFVRAWDQCMWNESQVQHT